MKTNINNLKITPKNLPFAFCVYGKPNEHILQWMKNCNITSIQSGAYTNLVLPDGINLQDIFVESKDYKYVDAFSPNLNKKLHFGHLTNLITAKFIQKIGIGENLQFY